MKKISYIFLVLAALSLLSCAKTEAVEPSERIGTQAEDLYPSPEPFEVETVPMVFDGELEPDPTEDTKAYVSGSAIYWQSTDQVGVFDNLRPDKHSYTVAPKAGNPRYATLSGSVTAGSTSWYAVYPQAAIACLSDGVCEVTLPHVQTMGANRVDPTALISIATASHMALSFHNVYALLSFKVSQSNITHIQIIGNQGSVLAGTVAVNASTGAVTAIKDPKTEIHLYPKSGDSYFATNVEYYVPILPYDSSVEGSTPLEGFTIIMYTSSETTQGTTCYVKRTDKTLSLARGQGQRLGNITSGTGYTSTTLAESTNVGYYCSKLDISFPGGNSHAYRVALYRDAACTDLVVAHNIPAANLSSSGPFSSNPSRFTFGPLDTETQYYFRGIDRTTGQPTIILTPHATTAFDVKEMAGSAAVGDVILAEDFSECCYGASADATGKGGPFRVSNVSTTIDAFTPFTGEIREGSGVYYMASRIEMRLFAFGRNALGATRLANWAEYSERQDAVSTCDATTTPVCARCGLLKLGAYSYTGGIVTPPITWIPAGKKAVVTVTVQAKSYSDTEKYIAIKSVDGKVTTLNGSDPYIDTRYFLVSNTFDTQTAEVSTSNYLNVTKDLTVYPGGRILIAGDRTQPGTTAGTDQCRLYVERVTLTLKSLSDASASGSLTFSNISYQSARVSFATTSGHTYQAYVNGSANDPDGNAIATITGNGSDKYIDLNKLYFGTTYQVRVHDVTASSDVGTGYVTTARIWQNTGSTGQRFVSIGWDQLFRTETGGTTQAYILEIWRGGSKILELNPIQPGQGNSEPTIFGNATILGAGSDKNGTSLDQGDAQGGPLNCPNYLTPTGVSIGGLEPNTAYNIRVRPRNSVTYTRYYENDGTLLTADQTVAHSLSPTFKGTSPNTITVKTDAAHVAASNELLWCRFEDCCVQQDFSNRTVGSVPYGGSKDYGTTKTSLPLKLTDLTTLFESVTNPYCMYAHNTYGHQMNTWRLGVSTKNIDGISGAVKGYKPGETTGGLNNVVVGDFGGWYCNLTSKPRMGQLMLVTNDVAFVNSPQLTDSYLGSNKLSPTGTACTLSFFAVETVQRQQAASATLTVKVWRNSLKSWEEVGSISSGQLQPWGEEGVSDTDYYKNDYSKRPSKYFSVDMTLYPGDAVRLEHQKVDAKYGVIVDDIKLIRK